MASLSPFPHPYARLTDLPCTDGTTPQHMAFPQEGDSGLREGRVLAAKHSALPPTPLFHISAAGSWSPQVLRNRSQLGPLSSSHTHIQPQQLPLRNMLT